MINIDTGLYILGGITTAASALGAYFSQRNHAKLNGNSTIQILSKPIMMQSQNTPSTTPIAAGSPKVIIVDGVTYTEQK